MAGPLPRARFLVDLRLKFADGLLMSICFMLTFVAMVQFGFVLMLLWRQCSPRPLGVRGRLVMLSGFVQSSREPGHMARLRTLASTL